MLFSKKITSELTKQDYKPRPSIEGVVRFPLKEFTDEGGSFVELGRLTKGVHNAFLGFEVAQVNFSEMLPGAVKATHLHQNQDDVWFVSSRSRLLVGLQDVREGSKTFGVQMRLVLGAGKPELLFIPRGVAHGAGNIWNEIATMVYFVNQQFSAELEKSDEFRLPPDFFGKDFWTIPHG